MELFLPHSNQNLLPYDGIVNYYGRIIDPASAEEFMAFLLTNIAWKNDEAIIFGKHIITKRKAAWYADQPFSYTYSKTTKVALPWTDELIQLKKIAEDKTGVEFNSCLLNLYHDGDEAMAWHSDDEKELVKNGTIGSMSFGAERKFMFKHKASGETTGLILESGSLLTMSGATQGHWLHRLTKSAKVKTPRINLTFRMMNIK